MRLGKDGVCCKFNVIVDFQVSSCFVNWGNLSQQTTFGDRLPLFCSSDTGYKTMHRILFDITLFRFLNGQFVFILLEVIFKTLNSECNTLLIWVLDQGFKVKNIYDFLIRLIRNILTRNGQHEWESKCSTNMDIPFDYQLML